MNPSLSYLATLAENGVDKSNSDSADSAFQQRKFLWKLLVSSSCFARCSSFKWDLQLPTRLIYQGGGLLGPGSIIPIVGTISISTTVNLWSCLAMNKGSALLPYKFGIYKRQMLAQYFDYNNCLLSGTSLVLYLILIKCFIFILGFCQFVSLF